MQDILKHKSVLIEKDINNYLEYFSVIDLYFLGGIRAHLDGNKKQFLKHHRKLKKIVTDTDHLKGIINNKTKSLKTGVASVAIVIDLLEILHDLADLCHKVINAFANENPSIPNFIKEDFISHTFYFQTFRKIDLTLFKIKIQEKTNKLPPPLSLLIFAVRAIIFLNQIFDITIPVFHEGN